MKVFSTIIPEVRVLTPRRFPDPRGFFVETWNERTLREAGIELDFVQDNLSFSAHPGTVRGLHFQAPPNAQAKLVRVGRGAVLDVAVDIRWGSPTYGQHVAVELSAENGSQLLIPAGFLHGFISLEPETEVLYKVDAHYCRDAEGSVRYDDPDLAIDWRYDPSNVVLSEKDASAPSFRDFRTPFNYADEGQAPFAGGQT